MPVRLRAAEERDEALVAQWQQHSDAEGGFEDFGPRERPREVARLAAPGVGAVDGMLIVEADGDAVGTVAWRCVRYGPNEQSRAVNIGISLAPSARGRGIGTAAQRLLVEYLFRTTDVHRVEASTDVENVAEQKALARAGFRPEGVIRGAQFRGGQRHDLVGFARLRTDAP